MKLTDAEIAQMYSSLEGPISFARRIEAATAEKCAKICGDVSTENWDLYKYGNRPERADPHYQGVSMGADACSEAIRATFGATEVPPTKGDSK